MLLLPGTKYLRAAAALVMAATATFALVMAATATTATAQEVNRYALPELLKDKRLVNMTGIPVLSLNDQARKGVSVRGGIVWLKGVHFTEGTLEVDLRGKDAFLNSFLGLAFHGIDTTRHEIVYFRPFNFRYPDTARRRWSVQYVSMPDNSWPTLRKSHPLVYENAVNPIPDPADWFHATIVVSHGWISVFVNHASTPSLQVQELKPPEGDMLGLWSDGLSEDFANLQIIPLPGDPLTAAEQAKQQSQHGYTVVNRAFVENRGVCHMDQRYGEGIAWLDDKTLTNGDIEFEVRGRDAFQQSFVGFAFHGVDDTTYEAVYFRPFNFSSPDSLRRTHAVQYVAEPAYRWRRLRTEFPAKYERYLSHAPDPNGWFHVRIHLNGAAVSVFVNGATQPAMEVQSIVNTGGKRLGLWVGDGSGGDWKNMRVYAN
jgi:hypothetical protein